MIPFILFIVHLLITIFLVIFFNNLKLALNAYDSAQDVSRYKPSAIFSSSFYLLWVQILFERVLAGDAVELFGSEGVCVVAESELVIINGNSDGCSFEFIIGVFGILDQFPDPSFLSIFIFCQILNVLW